MRRRVFNTRSEAVAYLVSEGIKTRQDALDKVSSALREIREIRTKAEDHVKKLKEDIGLAETEVEEIGAQIKEPKDQDKTCPKCGKDLPDLLEENAAFCPHCGTKLPKE